MRFITLILCFCFFSFLFGQVNYTAHDTVVPYNAVYGYGTNAGWFPPHTNVQISSLAAGDSSRNLTGAGCRSIRGAIPHDFITTWGLTADLNYWRHNLQVGLRENVAFIGFPHSSVEDPHLACGGVTCPVHNLPHKPGNFRGLYLPIWDGGLNGTPVNDANTYALYVYNIALTYKDYVRFWEVWNEPDFSFSPNAYAPPSNPNSWWNRSNFECDCPCMAGDIFNYIRLLRISWEVIKSVDSTAYICTGGLGYPSFLDAVLRYTDNPANGTVTTAYPHTGGAYFDVMSYHVYPQYSSQVSQWSSAQGRMVYNRHSDGAADGAVGKKEEMEAVLHNRGYNGSLYPAKEWIVTEHNISRRAFSGLIGGEDVQRNYMIKSQVLQQLAGVKQGYVYGIGEKQPLASAGGSFDLMGIYEALTNRSLNQPLTSAGVANLSLSAVLYGTVADTARTRALVLPAGVGGGAFRHPAGHFSYVLWAETTTDLSENASATYSFPVALQTGPLALRTWNYSQTGQTSFVSPIAISLTGTPIMLTEQTTLPVTLENFEAYALADGTVQLDWVTRSEEQNDFFTVERSLDGQVFEFFARVEGQDREQGSEYRLLDTSPYPERSWYRLRQTDLNGTTRVLGTVSVTADKARLSLKLADNTLRVGEGLDVEVRVAPEAARLSLRALDGRLLWQERPEVPRKKYHVPTNHLAPGMYLLVLEQENRRITQRLSIVP